MKRTDPKLKAVALWVSLVFGALFWLTVGLAVGTLFGRTLWLF